MDNLGYQSRTNLEYLEEIYHEFLKNPESVDPEWVRFFEGVEFAKSKGLDEASPEATSNDESKVQDLIKIYRDYGHLNASLDPLNLSRPSSEFETFQDLDISSISKDEKFHVAQRIGLPPSNLSGVLDHLESSYCGPIALQAGECSPKVRQWFIKNFEDLSFKLSKEQKTNVLKQLARTESLEKFIHTRYVGTKRFSIEGCDSLIPMLEHVAEKGANELGVKELVIGMAHRGRVNVLANFMNKALEVILAEFNGHMGTHKDYDADVKYHMGFSADKTTSQGKNCHVSLAFNPSHLEAVSAVACGMARAKQRKHQDTKTREKVIPLLIHGDASVIGQGVVAEAFQLSQLKGYTVGGAIHIIMNNQVGFTTSPSDARSTDYASDIAKAIKAPVILVNADHPEACIKAIDMALRFRQEFKQDVLIDLIGYRRYGHNEGDEPAFTQPLMYSKIKKHPTVYSQYSKQLDQEKILTQKESDEFYESKISNLQKIYEKVKDDVPDIRPPAFGGLWEGYKWATEEELHQSFNTKAQAKDLKHTLETLSEPPKDFKPHKKIKKLIEQRQKMFQEDKMDWGTVELLTYGSLILEGTSVRLSGQDSERGTFSHRHSVYYDCESGEPYSPLAHLKTGKDYKEFCVYNSPLSEMAVLGFEYGNSITDPSFLTIWEAQFGDFANGAQIIIDQFISSGEAKWYRSNGLVLLLPHGYEGQGPEHSSARLERFLQLCAQNNMQICNFTTPAQLFHGLRRQVKRNFRKPLVVMSPKSLLRHPKVISSKKDLTEGSFQEVIGDQSHQKAKRVVLCSGKIYYDLLEKQEENLDVALVRIEQLYPFPAQKLAQILSSFKEATEFVWAQEEPQNMGAYWFIAPKLKKVLQDAGKEPVLYYAGRTERASPATGSPSVHQEEQNDIINSCFNLNS